MRQEWTRRRYMKLGAARSLAGWAGEQGADFQGERAAGGMAAALEQSSVKSR